MDADFQEQYVIAEQAYSAGDFSKAEDVARQLLGKLDPLPSSGAEREATLAWRAFVALLLGHIHLYGKDDVSQGTEFYRLVLASEPQDTLRELAQQGLNEALERSPVVDVSVSAAAEDESAQSNEAAKQPASHDLIRDPFLNSSSTHATSGGRGAEETNTAIPWLKKEADEPRQLNKAKQHDEDPLVRVPQETSPASVDRQFEIDPTRLEAGLLRVTLKGTQDLESTPTRSAMDNQKPQPRWHKRLGLAWRSLRRS